MTNEEIILKSVQAHLTPAQRHEIAAVAYTPEQIAHAVEHIPDGLDELAAAQIHTFGFWKQNGKSVKRGEKALFTCPLWKYTDKPSKAQRDAAEAAGEEAKAHPHYYPTTSYMFSCLQVESSKPAPAGRFKSMDEIKAYNKMLAEQRRAARVSAAIIDALKRIGALSDSKTREACTKNLAALGACKVEKNPVKIPSKPELFETVLTYRDRSRHRHTVEGFRVERCGYTFFVTREIIPQSIAQKCKARRWNIVESRSGRAVATMMHSKAECADWLWKKFDPETLAKINLDEMEREKLAAPLEAIGTAV